MYNHAKPFCDCSFTTMSEYASMAEAANASETDEQLISVQLIVIISHATIFAGNVQKWHDKPQAE